MPRPHGAAPGAALPAWRALVALLLAAPAVVAQGAAAAAGEAAAAAVRWEAELQNLSFGALSEEEVRRLALGYAEEVAAALGVSVVDVLDLEGRPGRVTVAPAPSAAPWVPTAAAGNSTTAPPGNATDLPAGEAPGLRPPRPLRGIAYAALPCISEACGGLGLPSRDLAQEGYEAQWGAPGRDDLGVMAKLGANTVRLYQALGLGDEHDHAGFLDHAAAAGLDVIAGFDSPRGSGGVRAACPGFDCFEAWRGAALLGLGSRGFRAAGGWHPAVAMLVLMDEPDLLEDSVECQPKGAWCRAKAALSALDGVLAAEREAGVQRGRVKLTVTWSFATRTSIDGAVEGSGIFGFQDMLAGIADPRIADYAPRSGRAELKEAFRTRWVHGLNAQAPWSSVDEAVSKEYTRFQPVPWFIGEYRAKGQAATAIQSDLEAMDRRAAEGGDFLGATFFQFQAAYEGGGAEMDSGLFALGERLVGQTGEVCDREAGCSTWPVRCLSTHLPGAAGAAAGSAAALAAAWNGSLAEVTNTCDSAPRGGATTTTTTVPPATAPPTSRAGGAGGSSGGGGFGPPPPLRPLRGMAYGDLPCTVQACGGGGLPSEDMMQAGYEPQWGAAGRDDLGVMRALGANGVRLYHELGLGAEGGHGRFLDRAGELGLNVLPGFHTENANLPGECPGYDCFETWKAAALQGFALGFQRGGGWHPAVAMLILLNEPDFFETAPKCQPSGAWCRVKAALSALDGVLAAEREAGVAPGRVRLTVTWSFAMKASIDGKVEGPGTFGFQDMVAGIADPAIARYAPRASAAELAEAFRTRWVHGLNTQAPWAFVNEMISRDYARFAPVPWFVGEYGANGQDAATIQADLESMQLRASEPGGEFLGAAFFQFQTAYWKGGAEMNFGLFSLGGERLSDTGALCDKMVPQCRAWPIRCLSSSLPWLPGTAALRARAVAAAWGGSVPLGQGFCGGSRVRTAASAPPPEPPTTTTEAPRDANGLPALQPLRGVAYSALPCTAPACGGVGLASQGMLQEGYARQWGPGGRDDLGTIARLRANAVRLYHEFGLGVQHDHGGFLDRAQAAGLNVLPGFHSENAIRQDGCPAFDCYETWRDAALQGLASGCKRGDGWHPAVAMLVLLNEPDSFENAPKCQPSGAWCRVKAVLSALDGVLAAEREAGVRPGRVRLSVAWSFAVRASIDGKVTGPGIFGFQDVVAAVADPAVAGYTPRTPRAELEHAFRTRWVHGVNTQSPWAFVDEMISKDYGQFHPIPWFLGEYGATGQDAATVRSDLESMQRRASEGGEFLGTTFFQFQTAYWKGGTGVDLGLFALGEEEVAETGEVCDKEAPACRTWPIHCLATDLAGMPPGAAAGRAEAVAAAWGGTAQPPESASGFCRRGDRRLLGAGAAPRTQLACQVRAAAGKSAALVAGELGGDEFAQRLAARTLSVLGGASGAIEGRLSVTGASAHATEEDERQHLGRGLAFAWWGWMLLGCLVGFLSIAVFATGGVALAGKLLGRQQAAAPEAPEPASV